MDYGAASSIGQIGASIVTSYFNNKVAGIQADTANFVRAQNNSVVAAENKRDEVLTGAARWRQSVTNTRVRENAEKDQEVIEVNYWRQADQRKRASFSNQIRFAEEEGRMAAAAAMSGVSGSVVDMINNTAKLRHGMETTASVEADKTAEWDKNRLKFSQWWADLDQMDYSLILDNPRVLDYQTNLPKTTSLLAGINAKDVKTAAQGISFAFSQPSSSVGSGFMDAGSSGSGSFG